MFSEDRPQVLLTAPRMKILDELAHRGPMPAADIPGLWPFSRDMWEGMVHELAAVGLLEGMASVRAPGQTEFRLTSDGWHTVMQESAAPDLALAYS